MALQPACVPHEHCSLVTMQVASTGKPGKSDNDRLATTTDIEARPLQLRGVAGPTAQVAQPRQQPPPSPPPPPPPPSPKVPDSLRTVCQHVLSILLHNLCDAITTVWGILLPVPMYVVCTRCDQPCALLNGQIAAHKQVASTSKPGARTSGNTPAPTATKARPVQQRGVAGPARRAAQTTARPRSPPPPPSLPPPKVTDSQGPAFRCGVHRALLSV